MSITKVGTQTQGAPAAGAYTATLPTAAGYASGDLLVHVLLCKYDDTSAHTIDNGWSARTPTGTGGFESPSADHGTLFGQVFTKVATSGSETAPTVTPGATAANTRIWYTFALRKTNADWTRFEIVWGSDADATSPLGGTIHFSGTPTAGDAIIGMWGSPTDTGTNTPTPTLSATSLSGGTVGNSPSGESTVGDDMTAAVAWWTGFTGTASSDLTATVTLSGNTNHSGVFGAILVRDGVLGDFTGTSAVAPSVAIAATGTGTGTSAVAPSTAIATTGKAVGTAAVTAAVSIATTGTLIFTGTSAVAPSVAIATTGALGVPATSEVATSVAIATTGIATGTSAVTAAAAIASTGSGTGAVALSPAATIATTGSATGTSARTVSVAIATTGAIILTGTSAVTASVAIATTGGLTVPPIATQTWNRVGGRVRGGYASIDWTPPVAAPPAGITLSDEADVPFAKAFVVDSIDADGNSVITDRQTVFGPMLTVRIVVGGKDVTFFRNVRTPIPDWQFTEPFGYGPAVFNFEVIGPHEVLAEHQGDTNASVYLRDWLYRDAPMKIQLVDHATQTVHSTVWRGQLEDTIENDNNLQVIASGLWSGEAATRWLPNPLFGENKDIGQLIWRLSESVAGVRMKPEGGPTTGLENPRLGEMTQLEAATTLLRRAQTRTKGPYTLTPVPWGGNVFRMVEKDTETIDATFYGEGKQLRLQRVRAGEADRIFGRGTTPGGQRVRNGRYPGVLDDPDEAIQAPPYPFTDGRSFGLGTTDADTDSESGDGIYILLVRMQTYGLIGREDVESGVFNIAAEGGINRLRFRMGLELTGLVTPNIWDALFNVGRIGSSIWWSKVEPMAQTNWSIRWNTSADGSILSHHDGYDGDRRIVDKSNDYGVWTRAQMFDFSDKDLDEEQTPNIFGEVDFGDHGGLLRGSVDPGTVVTDDDFMHQLELRPGMNIRFPYTRWGDIVLRFPTFAISGGSSPSVTGRGSTRPVDSLPLWETLNEAKAARKNTDKLWWRQNRSSSKVSDAVGEFEEIGGQINDVAVTGGEYRVVRVLAGQIGMIERFRINTYPEREFVAAIFGLPIGVGTLNAACPDPLADKQGWITHMNSLNDDHRLLALWGEPGDPGGYSPGTKSAGHTLTGTLDDRAGFPYKTSEPDKFRPWVYLVLFSANDTTFYGGDQGRIMWNQELVGQ